MATMGTYCKAYPVSRFAAFPGWEERPLPPAPADPDAADDEPLDDRYLFLQENLVVTDGIFLDERIVFDAVTPEWTAFCQTTLEFVVPEVEPLPVFGGEADAAAGETASETASAEGAGR